MKKRIALLLAVVMCLSLTACGSTKLTTDNIGDYLKIDATVEDCSVESEITSIMGIPVKSHSGDAKIKIKAVNQSGAKFENVEIVCDVYTYVDAIPGPHLYGWEFKTGNTQTGLKPHSDQNRKRITITLPSDGNWSDTENLELALYEDGINYATVSNDWFILKLCGVSIVEVKGSVSK